jgi:hypothetical protein
VAPVQNPFSTLLKLTYCNNWPDTFVLCAGLAGKNSLDQALVDSAADAINEMREKLFAFHNIKDEAELV